MAETKLGFLTEKDGNTQNNQLEADSDSKSDQEWPLTSHSTGLSTSEEINTD
jgi:hypothetical protein